jgi:hypothetical protein
MRPERLRALPRSYPTIGTMFDVIGSAPSLAVRQTQGNEQDEAAIYSGSYYFNPSLTYGINFISSTAARYLFNR